MTTKNKTDETGAREFILIDNNYDRMNPSFEKLMSRLIKYAHIDYTTEAYPLSRAEAEMIVSRIETLMRIR